ncbi:MAG: methylated-DNA--[protein]-cysteine S-methyltransferase [Candidatus Thorarchaeota archaeon]
MREVQIVLSPQLTMAIKRVAVLEIEGEWVAGVFTSFGLYATSLPRRTRKEAIQAVNAEGMAESQQSEHREVLEAVYAVANGQDHPVLRTIRLDFSDLTKKQRKVMEETLKIPRGKTATYGTVASRARIPGGARFVGNVMAQNRLCPIVPCHRVVATKGLGGYGSGLDKKAEILALEGAFAD